MSFTQAEIDYLATRTLARLATVGADGQPDVVADRTRVALVIDDLVSIDPFIARGVRVSDEAAPPVERRAVYGDD